MWFTFLFILLQYNADEITLEQFGVKGNGTDETVLIENAFAYARMHGKSIRLQGKTYIFSPKKPVNLYGIPSIKGKGTFDLSRTGPAASNPSLKTIFELNGRKKLLNPGLKNLKKGSNALSIAKGLPLQKGDILFLTSAELLPNPKRDYYCKGQRCVVSSYGTESGKLVIKDSLNYDYQSATIWKLVDCPEFELGPDTRFITSPMNFITCFRFYYARANISGYFKNFSLTAIMYKSSSGTVKNMEADLPVTDNNGYSYCIQVADMSDVLVKNCKLTGGRHVISMGGGGLWEKEESGGKGHAGYPSVLTVDGGVYKGSLPFNNNINEHNGTLDSHGIAERMIIRNCTIYGGVNLGANYVLIDSCTIYADKKRILNVGSDVVPKANWGHYTITNTTFIADPNVSHSLIYGKAGINDLILQNITVEGLKEGVFLADLRFFTPANTVIRNLRMKNSANKDRLIIKHKRGDIDLKGSGLTMASIKEVD